MECTQPALPSEQGECLGLADEPTGAAEEGLA